jgi:hypothetical protein
MSDEAARGDDSTPDDDSTADDEHIDEATSAQFLDDLIARGEVVPQGADLPPGATHELDENGKLRRRRFSAY